jgi:hypothetical protein
VRMQIWRGLTADWPHTVERDDGTLLTLAKIFRVPVEPYAMQPAVVEQFPMTHRPSRRQARPGLFDDASEGRERLFHHVVGGCQRDAEVARQFDDVAG